MSNKQVTGVSYRESLDRAARALNSRIAKRHLIVRNRCDAPKSLCVIGRVVSAFRRGVFLYYQFSNGNTGLVKDYVEHR